MNIFSQKNKDIIHALVEINGNFPNNGQYPLLIYKKVAQSIPHFPKKIPSILAQNSWVNSWEDGIYDYHHYHSNTHEVLVVVSGQCNVQIGGNEGLIYRLSLGDVIVIPAGVAHKNVGCTIDFKCIGAYPSSDVQDYDMHYGLAKEHPQVDINIKAVGLPVSDPIFGKKGILFDYWK